jgi:predicted O-linked N-acetylglucosamine transferase (SPINDLY family)
MAVRLSRDRRLLASYRDHLNRNRASLALFDTARTTSHIEAAYEEMMTRWSDGERPAGFAVRQQDT